MKSKRQLSQISLAALGLFCMLQLSSAFAAPIVVTYQGRLTASGTNFTGAGQFKAVIATSTNNITFPTSSWSNDGTSSAGSEPAAAVSATVAGGLFTLPLGDSSLANMMVLDASVFTQSGLKLRLWFNDGVSGFVLLNPPQPLTFAPYAATAINASNLLGTLASSQLIGTLPSTQLSGTYSSAVTLNNAANSFTGSGAGLTALNADNLSSGNVPSAALGNAWKTTGNSGTTAGANFIGTTDDQPLEFKVKGARAMRLEPGISANGAPNVIGGSPRNFVAASASGAVIAGGGATNYAGGAYTNSVSADFGTVGGGAGNSMSGPYGTIAGGRENSIPGGAGSAIGGGNANTINSGFTSYSTIAGGAGNSILNGGGSTIGGGQFNTTDVGFVEADATISGGRYNTVSGRYGAVPGGDSNAAGQSGFAAGHRAKATHTGSFVWADSTEADFATTADQQFLIRATGGVGIGTTSPTNTLQVNGGVSATAFVTTSDRNAKENFRSVDVREVLDKVAALPISTWNYKAMHDGPHMGPMAQDFYAAFGLGGSETTITTIDPDGVALAAIQGLNQKLEQKETEIAELRKSVAKLEAMISKLAGERNADAK